MTSRVAPPFTKERNWNKKEFLLNLKELMQKQSQNHRREKIKTQTCSTKFQPNHKCKFFAEPSIKEAKDTPTIRDTQPLLLPNNRNNS